MRHTFPDFHNIFASDQPAITLVTEYAIDKNIIKINTDPLIASKKLQSLVSYGKIKYTWF